MADAIVICPPLEWLFLCIRLMREVSRVDTCQARGSGYRFGLACVRVRWAGFQKMNLGGTANGSHGCEAEMAVVHWKARPNFGEG